MLSVNSKNLIKMSLVAVYFAATSHSALAQGPMLVTLTSTDRFSGAMQQVEAYLAESVDVAPSFPGGDAALRRYVNSERRYPRRAYEQRIQGRVVCGIVVEPDGSISSIDVIRGVEASLNSEAVRIIESMPRWEAGELEGRKVPVYCIIAIPFRR